MADDHTLSAPSLPMPVGSAQPIVAPPLSTPLRPWEQRAMSGSFDSLQASRRAERYGEPVASVWRAVVASVAIVAAMVAGALSVLAFWDRRSLLVDADGDLSLVDSAAFAAADDRIVDTGIAAMIVAAIAGIAVIAWTYRAYRTVGAWRPIELRLRWSVLGWIVPLVNLIVPLRILTEIVDGSSRGGHGRRIPLMWWGFWTLPIIVSFGLRNVEPSSIDGLIAWDTVAAASAVCTLVSGAFLIAIIVRSTGDQRRRIAEQRLTPSLSF